MAAGTRNIVNMFPILHLLTCCDSTISNQASPHLLRSLEPFPELWKRARSSLGASMAPPSRKGGGEPARSPKSQFRAKGSGILSHTTWRPFRGLPRPPSGWAQQAPGPGNSDTGRVRTLRTGLALNLTSDTAPRSPQRGSWSLGLTAWPEPWPHSPTGALEARPSLLGGAHPKPPPQRPIAL